MKKTNLSIALSILLLSNSVPTSLLHAESKWYNPSSWFDKKSSVEPATFDKVYPVPFYKTGVFKWGSIIAASIAVGIITVSSGGVAAVPGATWIGSLIGGAMGTTWTAGLAALGGGALATGGFGMAGGAVVIATVTDLSLMVLVDKTASTISQNNKTDFTTIKVPIPEWDKGSKYIVQILKNIKDLKEKLKDGDIKEPLYESNLRNYLEEILRNIDHNNYYDLVTGAIVAYDLGKFELAEKYIRDADFKTEGLSSFIEYLKSLLALSKNDIRNAENYLDNAIRKEPDALSPYLLLANTQIDNNNLYAALETVKSGLENYDDDNFQLNYLAGLINFKLNNYRYSIDYFKEALSNTTINPVEAECKMRIAILYNRLGESKKAGEWYQDALDEVDDQKYARYRDKLINMYRNL